MKTYNKLALFLVMPVLLLALSHTSANALSTIGQTLSLGSSGPDVVTLQTYLAADATLYPEGLITGYFGPLTQAAVIRFQTRYGIEQVGRVGPITLAKLNSLISGGVIVNSDQYAPIMTAIAANVGPNSATISWKTNESARSRVMYSSAYPFLYASAASSADANMDLDQSVMLSGLVPNTKYYYVLESIDASGNIMWTTAFNLTTTQ